MLETKLLQMWQSNKFANAILLSSEDLQGILVSLLKFLSDILLPYTNIPIEHNPDIYSIRHATQHKVDKFITVDQIRQLQKWIYKKAALSPYKFIIIEYAEAMNNSASNCCLKMLEDTPKYTYFFLLSRTPNNLLVTIRSRCQFLRVNNSSLDIIDDYKSLLVVLTKSEKHELVSYIESLKEDNWQSFKSSLTMLTTRWLKFRLESLNELIQGEQELFFLLPRGKLILLLAKVDKINQWLEEAEKFSLEYKYVGLMVLFELSLLPG